MERLKMSTISLIGYILLFLYFVCTTLDLIVKKKYSSIAQTIFNTLHYLLEFSFWIILIIIMLYSDKDLIPIVHYLKIAILIIFPFAWILRIRSIILFDKYQQKYFDRIFMDHAIPHKELENTIRSSDIWEIGGIYYTLVPALLIFCVLTSMS